MLHDENVRGRRMQSDVEREDSREPAAGRPAQRVHHTGSTLQGLLQEQARRRNTNPGFRLPRGLRTEKPPTVPALQVVGLHLRTKWQHLHLGEGEVAGAIWPQVFPSSPSAAEGYRRPGQGAGDVLRRCNRSSGGVVRSSECILRFWV